VCHQLALDSKLELIDHDPNKCAFCPNSAPTLSSWLLGSFAFSLAEESSPVSAHQGSSETATAATVIASHVSTDLPVAEKVAATPASKSIWGFFSNAQEDAASKPSSLRSSLMGTLSRLGTALTEPLRVHTSPREEVPSAHAVVKPKGTEHASSESSGYVNLKGMFLCLALAS
jgi:hypothetical protein